MAMPPPAAPKGGTLKEIPYPFGKRYSLYALGLLYILGLINYVDRAAVSGVGSHLIREFGLTDTQYGLIPLSFMLVYSLVAYPAARFTETRGRTRVMGIGVGIWSVATLFTGWAKSIPTLFVSRGVLGIGEASYAAASSPLVSDYFPSKHRAKVVSIINSAVGLGSAVGLLMGALVATTVAEKMVYCHQSSQPTTLCMMAERTGAKVLSQEEANRVLPPLSKASKSSEHASEEHVTETEKKAGVEVLGEWRLVFMIVGLPGLVLAIFSFFLREPALGYFDKLEQGVPLDAKAEKRPALLPNEIEETVKGMGPVARFFYRLLPSEEALKKARPIKRIICKALSEFILINSRLLQTPSVRVLYLNGILITGAMGTIAHFLQPYLTQNLGFGNKEFQIIGGGSIVGGLFGLIASGMLTDWLNRRIPSGTMWVVGIGSLLGAPVIFAFMKGGIAPSAATVPIFALLVAVASFFLMGVAGPTQSACIDVVPPHLRTTMAGTYMFLIHIFGDGPLPFVVGAVSDQIGRANALAILSGLCFLSGGVALTGIKHYSRDKQKVLDDLKAEYATLKMQTSS